MKLKDFDFRIWDVNYKGCSNKNCKCQSNFIYGEEAKIRLSEFVNKDVEIELWTGFYDKDGNKIFEGDILENDHLKEIYCVIRDDEYKDYRIVIYRKDLNNEVYKKENDHNISFFKIYPSNESIRVIGNIHENTELLKS
ncbi:TPA: hypothetical protein RTH13_001179 [Campylobacter jejuni]|nr:hypothetical protein [Campylobacter jejuni]HDZ5096286.1 hypothetical protein [Campylobacter jejuni]HDZ5129048.1 hypothetical protein [Campylobacter jejuni]HDZ5130913.1 hypothetical protein [Campylobacter jejuni]